MKILHISTTDTEGGAAKATYKLHKELLNQNIDSQILVLHKFSNDQNIIPFKISNKINSRLRRFIERKKTKHELAKYQPIGPENYEIFTLAKTSFTNIYEYTKDFDIINLHWISGFIDYKSFFKQHIHKKLVWRLADMNPFTGGCHYSWGCENFQQKCGNCQQLNSNLKNDLSNKIWQAKHEAFQHIENNQLHIVCLGNWMLNNVKNCSLLSRFNKSIIPNGVELQIFNMYQKTAAKQSLGIDINKKTILLIAESMNNRRKGYKHAIETLARIKDKNEYCILIVGTSTQNLHKEFQQIHFGRIDNKILLAVIYNAADVFLYTSLEENFPNTALESISCGTPVIGYNTGGISDIIINHTNGLLTNAQSPIELHYLLEKYFSENLQNKFEKNAREIAELKFDIKKQAQDYIKLYKFLLNI